MREASWRLKKVLLEGPDSLKCISHSILVEPAVHLAAEALHLDFCDKLPDKMYSVLDTFSRNLRNDQYVGSLLLGSSKFVDGAHRVVQDLVTLSDFRTSAFNALLPHEDESSSLDLAVTAHGFVAFTSILGHPTTDRRQCNAISIAPRTIRYNTENSSMNFSKIVEKSIQTSIKGAGCSSQLALSN